MREIRLFHNDNIAEGQTLVLDNDTHVHVSRVLRLNEGNHVTLINGDGYDYYGHLTEISKKSSTVFIEKCVKNLTQSETPVVLLIGLLKGVPMDYVLQKSVELGVTEIIPLQTERSERKIDAQKWEKKEQHWLGILKASCLQCGRAELPLLGKPIAFMQVLDQFSNQERWILSPHHENHCVENSQAKNEGIALMVGPEGGFSEAEIQAATNQGWQTHLFGNRVLRADTAAIVGLTCAQIKLKQFVIE